VPLLLASRLGDGRLRTARQIPTGEAERCQCSVVVEHRAVSGDRPDGELWLRGCADLASHHDVQRGLQLSGHARGYRHPASRQRQHHGSGPAVLGQFHTQLPACGHPIPEAHTHLSIVLAPVSVREPLHWCCARDWRTLACEVAYDTDTTCPSWSRAAA